MSDDLQDQLGRAFAAIWAHLEELKAARKVHAQALQDLVGEVVAIKHELRHLTNAARELSPPH